MLLKSQAGVTGDYTFARGQVLRLVAAGLAESERAAWSEAEEVCDRFLGRHWSTIERLAAELKSHLHLEEDRLLELLSGVSIELDSLDAGLPTPALISEELNHFYPGWAEARMAKGG